MSRERAPQKKKWGVGSWVRIYVLLLLIFVELVAFVFQNIEKKRLGYELSILVNHKRQLVKARDRQRVDLLQWENLDQIAGMVREASMGLEANRWPVLWSQNDD